jgi:16S rRNA (guanine966-N2)-methyltransferase
VLLVESDPRAGRVIRDNIALLGAGTVARLAPSRVESVLPGGPLGEGYDIVVADPPYDTGETEITALLTRLVEHGWLADDALVIVERGSRSPEPAWPEGLAGERCRRYGETTLWYGRGL